MDKGRKLRRYNRKDYTQLVDFPVEIVGRDGVVRRYSFEESVRLYQRRIASARMRYDDGDIVKAEVRHCRRRIEQLRKSYFARYGWEALKTTGGGRLTGEHAGEVAAFLRKCLGAADPGLESVELAFLDQQEHCRLYFVRGRLGLVGAGSSLLYLYEFDNPGSCPGREQFFGYLKVLQSVRKAGPGVESLVAFHHTADCGLILTSEDPSRSAVVDTTAGGDDVFDGDEAPAPNPLRDALVLLRKGREEEALDQMEATYAQHPYLRHAYLGAAVVADLLGAHGRAETAALMGTRYFPQDGLLAYHLAVARLRAGDARAAEPLIAVVADSEGGAAAAQLLRALVSLSDNRLNAGRRHLSGALREAERTETARHSDLAHAAKVLQLHLALRTLGALLALAVVTAGFGLYASGWNQGALAFGVIALGIAALPVGRWWWRQRLQRLLRGPGQAGLRLASVGALEQVNGEG